MLLCKETADNGEWSKNIAAKLHYKITLSSDWKKIHGADGKHSVAFATVLVAISSPE